MVEEIADYTLKAGIVCARSALPPAGCSQQWLPPAPPRKEGRARPTAFSGKVKGLTIAYILMDLTNRLTFVSPRPTVGANLVMGATSEDTLSLQKVEAVGHHVHEIS
jgi:hypothetical protein